MKEDHKTEWKETWRDEFLKVLCGFANAEGGVLVIGRDDEGNPVGVRDARKLMEELPNKARDVLGVMVNVRLRTVRGKELVEVRTDPYPGPISYRGEYYLRKTESNCIFPNANLALVERDKIVSYLLAFAIFSRRWKSSLMPPSRKSLIAWQIVWTFSDSHLFGLAVR